MPIHAARDQRRRNRVAMADLREVVLGLGHTEVATYIQSRLVLSAGRGADATAGVSTRPRC